MGTQPFDSGSMPGSVLLVGNEPKLLEAAAFVLRGAGYEASIEERFESALEILKTTHFDLLVVDMSMTTRSGWDLIEHVQSARSSLATVMLAAADDDAVAQRALELGAYGFLTIPFQPSGLLIAASNALRRKTLEVENRDIREGLEDEVQVRTAALMDALKVLEASEEELLVSREDTIECLGIAAEFNEPGSAAHVRRMSRYCELLAQWAGLDPEHCDKIRITSIMHDVGKIGIRDSVLMKPGKFTPEEFAIMKGHAVLGHRILVGPKSELLGLAATIALTHHEWYDGSGYPHGLKGEEIPLEGRIAAIADVFDALMRHRVYRPAMTLPEAIQTLKEGRGSHFDPELLDLFLANLDEVLVAKAREEEAADARWLWLDEEMFGETDR